MSVEVQCTRCAARVEASDLRCPVCCLARAPVDAGPIDAVRADILRCNGCGAAVTYSLEHQTARCNFCGEAMHVERPIDPLEQPELVLPFRVSTPEASAALAGWLKSLGAFRPRDLASTATLEHLTPVLFAGWITNATALVSWTAIGDRTTPAWSLGSTPSGGGGGHAGLGHLRDASNSLLSLAVPWLPHAGQDVMAFERILLSASRGLTDREVGRLAPAYDLTTAAPIGRRAIPTGATVESFDVQRSEARRALLNSLRRVALERVAGLFPSGRVRDAKVALVLQGLSTHRGLFPVFVLAYRYRNKLYRCVVHGQDASVVHGNAPYDIVKIALVVILAPFGLALLMLLLTALPER